MFCAVAQILQCSSINSVRHLLFLYSVLDHEGVTEVIKHKSTNNKVKIGDRLIFSIANSCLQCGRCVDGIEQKCTSLFKVFIHPLFSKMGKFYVPIFSIRSDVSNIK